MVSIPKISLNTSIPYSYKLNYYETREQMESRLRDEREKIQSSIDQNNDKINDYTSRLSSLKSKINDDKNDIESDKSKLTEIEHRYEDRKSKLNDELNSDEEDLRRDEDRYESVQNHLSDLKRMHSNLVDKLNSVK
mgnify:FL=1